SRPPHAHRQRRRPQANGARQGRGRGSGHAPSLPHAGRQMRGRRAGAARAPVLLVDAGGEIATFRAPEGRKMTDPALATLARESNAWPFQEARKLLDRFAGETPAKGYVLFETGYGPSGLP